MPRVFAAALTAALVAVLGVLAPAGAEEEPANPMVGGRALERDGLVIDGQPSSPLPAPGAKTFLIADLDSGEVLAAQGAHVQLPPASTLKMLTALTVLPRVEPETIYTATDEDVSVAGSKVGIASGSTYTARQLFEGLFLISGNDVATAIANLNGGVEPTLEQMQAEAWRLQAYRTVPGTPSGLDAPGQVSSAYDLALIARAGMAREDFAGLAGLTNSTFPTSGTGDPEQRDTFEIWNQNDLVNGGYPGAIGVKSGFTTQAGRTFAAAAERDGRRILVTLMGIEGNTYGTGAAFLDWAFANADSLQPVGELVEPKFALSQSDSAAVVEEAEEVVAAVPAQAEPAATSRSLQPLLAIITAVCWLLLAGLVRRPQRDAFRRRTDVNLAGRSRHRVGHKVG